MKNTPENKAKFFALYWGQNVLVYPVLKNGVVKDSIIRIGSDNRWTGWVSKGILELKPLSQITDEDAIEVGKIVFNHLKTGVNISITNTADRDFGFSFWLNQTSEYCFYWDMSFICLEKRACHSTNINSTIPEIIDFLRSKGYALPWMGVSIEQQIEWGWVKLVK